MTKSELTPKNAAERSPLYYRDVERILNTVFGRIIKALREGDRVKLRGFGSFSVKPRHRRVGRNPRTGQSVEVRSNRVPFFRAGKDLRERLNPTHRDFPARWTEE